MKYFQNLKETDGVLTFELLSNNKIDKSLANAIRRNIISRTPLIAIDKESVNFLKNTSVLHNEILSKRLALIPISYVEAQKYDLDKLEIRLKSENQIDEIKDVICRDFQIWNGDKQLDIKRFIPEEEILFAKLKPFQSLELMAKFKESTQHQDGAEFSPTCVAIFTYKENPKALQEALKSIPNDKKKDFTIENQERLYLKNLDSEPLVYNFTIETVGQLPNKAIVKSGFEILINQLDRLVRGLMENVREIIYIDVPKISMVAYDFTIPDEGDTIGHLMQSYLLKNDKVGYAAYDIVHPLTKVLVIRMALKENNSQVNNRNIFIQTITEIKKLIMEMRKEWK